MPYYQDVDIVNAAPTILNQALVAAGINCPYLSSYVQHRGVWLAALMDSCKVSKDVAKELGVALLHGGSYSG
jgi:hypothetical protein